MLYLHLLLLFALLPACVSAADALPLVQDHVLFFVTASMLWALGQMAKGLAPKAASGAVWRLFRRTLPWHPVFGGAWLGGAFPSLLPHAVGAGRMAAILYFGGAGVLAAYAHDVYRTWAKHGGGAS